MRRRTGQHIIRFENVGLRYGQGPEILQDVTFALPSGSFHFLTGASGAGKSTLMRLMFLGMRPTRGRVLMFDRDIATMPRYEMPALRRRIGVVFQDFRLMDHLSALDNVALPLRVRGVREAEIQKHVPELLSWVGLTDQIHAKPSTLSGGQKQRVAIARAVIGRPDLLLADEPTGNVDDEIATRLLHLFEELNRLGTTVVIATHSEALVEQFGQYPRLHIDQGMVLQVEKPVQPPEPGPVGLSAIDGEQDWADEDNLQETEAP